MVAELDGEMVGIGVVVLELNQLRACYVAPEGVRKGVGTQIVLKLKRIARENGVRLFNLVSSITAERFYRALGYSSDKKVQHVLSTGVAMDAIQMSKKL